MGSAARNLTADGAPYHPRVTTARAQARSRRGLRLLERLAGLTPSGRAGVPVAWALYDFANTIYSDAIVSFAMGLWVNDRLGPADGQFWFGVANAASVGLNALVSPVLGTMSDRGGRRMPYLLFFPCRTRAR